MNNKFKQTAQEMAKVHSWSIYWNKHPNSFISKEDIKFKPEEIEVEGYKGFLAQGTNFVYCYDEKTAYPMQEIERVYNFKR